MADFQTIRPGDIDNFTFDFTQKIGTSGRIVGPPVWTCIVSPDSVYLDATPSDRLLGVPSYTDTQTSHQAGLMLDGVTYTLSVVVNIDDGRVYSSTGEVECTDAEITDKKLTVEKFRRDFPEFSDATIYTNDSIQVWIDAIILDNAFTAYRWGAWELLGEELYIAHQLALGMYGRIPIPGGGAGGAGATPSVPGLFSGTASSKSVNGVSIGYDTHMGLDSSNADMGEYALTLYGRRLWTLIRSAGAGPIQF